MNIFFRLKKCSGHKNVSEISIQDKNLGLLLGIFFLLKKCSGYKNVSEISLQDKTLRL